MVWTPESPKKCKILAKYIVRDEYQIYIYYFFKKDARLMVWTPESPKKRNISAKYIAREHHRRKNAVIP